MNIVLGWFYWRWNCKNSVCVIYCLFFIYFLYNSWSLVIYNSFVVLASWLYGNSFTPQLHTQHYLDSLLVLFSKPMFDKVYDIIFISITGMFPLLLLYSLYYFEFILYTFIPWSSPRAYNIFRSNICWIPFGHHNISEKETPKNSIWTICWPQNKMGEKYP